MFEYSVPLVLNICLKTGTVFNIKHIRSTKLHLLTVTAAIETKQQFYI